MVICWLPWARQERLCGKVRGAIAPVPSVVVRCLQSKSRSGLNLSCVVPHASALALEGAPSVKEKSAKVLRDTPTGCICLCSLVVLGCSAPSSSNNNVGNLHVHKVPCSRRLRLGFTPTQTPLLPVFFERELSFHVQIEPACLVYREIHRGVWDSANTCVRPTAVDRSRTCQDDRHLRSLRIGTSFEGAGKFISRVLLQLPEITHAWLPATQTYAFVQQRNKVYLVVYIIL